MQTHSWHDIGIYLIALLHMFTGVNCFYVALLFLIGFGCGHIERLNRERETNKEALS